MSRRPARPGLARGPATRRAARVGLAGCLCAAAACAQAADFVVTTTADGGPGSLRQALLEAEANAVADTIAFAIPGCGGTLPVCTIRPLSPLPAITRGAVLIDGYTQPGAHPNTLRVGEDAVLAIELDGRLAGGDGLVLGANGIAASASGSLIRGLVVNGFAGSGIRIEGERCDSNQTGCFVREVAIRGCFIGTDASGAEARGNGNGIRLGTNAIANVIGDPDFVSVTDPANRNVISGNDRGVLADTGSGDSLYPARSNVVRNNYVGYVHGSGSPPLGNALSGVELAASATATLVTDNLIGYGAYGVRIDSAASAGLPETTVLGSNAIVANAEDGVSVRGDGVVGIYGSYVFGDPLAGTFVGVAGNGGAGIYVEDSAIVSVVDVSTVGNGGLGIDLAPRGPNPNDPQDVDGGPNEGQNYPLVASATFVDVDGGSVRLQGTLNTTPNTEYGLEFRASEDCDPSGYGEGTRVLFTTRGPDTDAQGDASFDFTSPVRPSDRYVTALVLRADATGAGNVVSEYSPCAAISGRDLIFANGFDP